MLWVLPKLAAKIIRPLDLRVRGGGLRVARRRPGRHRYCEMDDQYPRVWAGQNCNDMPVTWVVVMSEATAVVCTGGPLGR